MLASMVVCCRKRCRTCSLFVRQLHTCVCTCTRHTHTHRNHAQTRASTTRLHKGPQQSETHVHVFLTQACEALLCLRRSSDRVCASAYAWSRYLALLQRGKGNEGVRGHTNGSGKQPAHDDEAMSSDTPLHPKPETHASMSRRRKKDQHALKALYTTSTPNRPPQPPALAFPSGTVGH
jgi:hypothetical protein